MRDLRRDHIVQCREAVGRGTRVAESLVKYVGGHQLASGLWRLFSGTFPPGGAMTWNSPEIWKGAWGLSADAFFAFGEDLFGNQLVIPAGGDVAMIWNHESGELADLVLGPIELLDTCLDSGLGWIEFYTPAMLEVGRVQLPEVPNDSHLHWTTPLILGGSVLPSNTSVVERRQHLEGHAALHRQISGLDHGAFVIPKPTPS